MVWAVDMMNACATMGHSEVFLDGYLIWKIPSFIVLSFQGLAFPVDPISFTEQVTENFQSFANPHKMVRSSTHSNSLERHFLDANRYMAR